MNVVLNKDEFLKHAKFYLYREGIVNENFEIIDQESFNNTLNVFNENIAKYTLDLEEFFLLEKFIFVKRNSLLIDEFFSSINDVISIDYSRAAQGVDKEMKFHYYFLSGVVWERIRNIIDTMRSSNFKKTMV